MTFKNPDRDPYLSFLCIIFLGVTLFFAIFSIYPDLNLDYPFMGGDSYDWISNGLYYSGADVRYSVRPPLLPLIMAFLVKTDILSYLPALIWAVVFLASLIFYRLLTFYVKNMTAFFSALALFLNYSFQYQSLEIMADVLASCLLLFSVYYFIRAQKRKQDYLFFGLFGGLSAITQQLALLLPIPLFLSVALFRRGDLKIKQLWGGAVIFALFPGSWFLYKYIRFKTAGDIMVRQWGLLNLHFDRIGTYLYAGLSYLGIAGFILLVAGLLIYLKKALKDRDRFFFTFLFLIILAFLVFFYDFSYKRFLVYIFWFGGLFIAAALSALKNRAVYTTAVAALLFYSVFPLPGKGVDPSRIALWPAPLAYLKVDFVPSEPLWGKLDLSSVRVEFFSPAKLPRFSNYYRVWNAAKNKKSKRGLDPEIFKKDKAAIYVYDESRESNFRFPTVLRLGNTLRKKVKYLPSSFISRYVDFLPLEAVADSIDYTVYRFSPPGMREPWLLVFSSRNTFYQKRQKREEITDSMLAGLSAGLKKAREISDYIQDSDAKVIVINRGNRKDLSFFFLPFLIETTEFIQIDRAETSQAEKSLADFPVLDQKRFGKVVVKKISIFKQSSSAIFY